MKRLPSDTEQKLLAIMRESAEPFDEEQACRDFAGILERLHMLDRDGSRPGIRRPWGTLRILAHEAAQTYHHHTAEVLGRTTKGGRGARFLMVLADAAGITDPSTGKPYTLQKAADTVQAVQKGLNSQAALDVLPKFTKGNEGTLCNSDVEAKRNDPARDDARVALLEPHQEGKDAEGWPIIEGYERAPDRSRTVQDRIPRDALDRLIAESEVAPNKLKG